MGYSWELVPVEIKYDFICKLNGANVSSEWIGCRLNMKPLEKLDGWLKVMCYPKRYAEASPYFLFECDIKDLKCGPVASRTQSYVYGLFWKVGTKRCKFFFSFADKPSYDAYITYLKDVLRLLEKCVDQRENADGKSPSVSLNLSWIDGLVGPLNETKDILPTSGTAEPIDSGRVSDASDIYEEVQLRSPKDTKQRQTRRPMAILSDLFTTKQTKSVSSDLNLKRSPQLPPRNRLSVEEENESKTKKTLKKKLSIWKLMTKSKKSREIDPNGDQGLSNNSCHQSSTSSSKNLSLHSCECSKSETIDDVVDLDAIPVDALLKLAQDDFDFMQEMEATRANVSLSMLGSQNMSQANESSANIFDINLVGANVNSEQTHSEIFVEQDSRKMTFNTLPTKSIMITHTGQEPELDENGYAVMRPIINDKCPGSSYDSVDDFARNVRNLELGYDIVPPRPITEETARMARNLELGYDIVPPRPKSEGMARNQEFDPHIVPSRPMTEEVDRMAINVELGYDNVSPRPKSDGVARNQEFDHDIVPPRSMTGETTRMTRNLELGYDIVLSTRKLEFDSSPSSGYNSDDEDHTLTPKLEKKQCNEPNSEDEGISINSNENTSVSSPNKRDNAISKQTNYGVLERAIEKLFNKPVEYVNIDFNKENRHTGSDEEFPNLSNETTIEPQLTIGGTQIVELNEEKVANDFATTRSTMPSISNTTNKHTITTKPTSHQIIDMAQEDSPECKTIIRKSTPYRLRNSKHKKRRLATSRSNGLLFSTDRKTVSEINPPTQQKVEALQNDSGKTSPPERRPLMNATDGAKLGMKLKSISRRFWLQTCAEIQEKSVSLVSAPMYMYLFDLLKKPWST